jgi:hypothetical protein
VLELKVKANPMHPFIDVELRGGRYLAAGAAYLDRLGESRQCLIEGSVNVIDGAVATCAVVTRGPLDRPCGSLNVHTDRRFERKFVSGTSEEQVMHG